ncbi:MAG: hypothetical protein M3463_16565, partial [Verrucomicrobiota bacterium]|nr:hypothetical protein [Verrucomicrobiota bacterium]
MKHPFLILRFLRVPISRVIPYAGAWLVVVLACYGFGRASMRPQAENAVSAPGVARAAPRYGPGARHPETGGARALTSSESSIAAEIAQVKDFPATFFHLDARPDSEEKHDRLLALAAAWGAADPVAAIAFFHAQKVQGWRNPFLFAAITEWGERDAGAAVAWVQARFSELLAAKGDLPEPDFSRREEAFYYLTGIVRGLARREPARAAELLNLLPGGARRAS